MEDESLTFEAYTFSQKILKHFNLLKKNILIINTNQNRHFKIFQNYKTFKFRVLAITI